MSDEYSNKLTDDIVKYGFEVIMVPQTNYLPSFAYTVGLWKSYKHPELISLGLPIDTLHTMLNTVAFEVIKKEKLIEIGTNYHDILEKYPVQFLTVDKRNIPDYFGQAISYYQTVDFPALQLIWPDDKGIFPYESDFREDLIYLQPLLDRNADFKFREDKLCPVFTTSAWLENQQPIVEVIHDKEGHWFFLPLLCQENGLTYIDLYKELVTPGSQLLDPAYTNNGLHLVGAAYFKWRDFVLPFVKE